MEKHDHVKARPKASEKTDAEEPKNKPEHQHSDLMDSEDSEMSDLLDSENDQIAALFEEESSEVNRAVLEVKEKLTLLSEQTKALNERVISLQQRSEQTHSLQQVVSDLGKECSSLREQQHEREFIIPLACVLIGIADRCKEQIQGLVEMIDKNETATNKAVVKALRYIIRSRKADQTEIEGVIAGMGIESYESPETHFNPELQTCLRRIESKKSRLHLQIAARILPGYRRYQRVIRKEIVSLYVNHNPSDEEKDHVLRN